MVANLDIKRKKLIAVADIGVGRSLSVVASGWLQSINCNLQTVQEAADRTKGDEL